MDVGAVEGGRSKVTCQGQYQYEVAPLMDMSGTCGAPLRTSHELYSPNSCILILKGAPDG